MKAQQMTLQAHEVPVYCACCIKVVLSSRVLHFFLQTQEWPWDVFAHSKGSFGGAATVRQKNASTPLGVSGQRATIGVPPLC